MEHRHHHPVVGRPHDSTTTCLYRPTPDGVLCTNPPTRHIIVYAINAAGQSGIGGMASCNEHVDIARATGALIGDHPFVDDCNAHDTDWRQAEDRCYRKPREG